MATTITAGNATNGAAISSDNTGILELKSGTGSGTTALTLNASQNATLAGTLTVGSTLQVAGVTTNMYPLVSGTSQTAPFTAPNTSCDFTGIPSWAKRITVMFSGVSTNGSSGINVQLGTSSGVENTNYVCGNVYFSATGINGATATTGFSIRNTLAADSINGSLTISLLSNSTNTWASQGILGSGNSANNTFLLGGSKSLAGTLDRVRITSINGTDTFDAGTINILYE